MSMKEYREWLEQKIEDMKRLKRIASKDCKNYFEYGMNSYQECLDKLNEVRV